VHSHRTRRRRTPRHRTPPGGRLLPTGIAALTAALLGGCGTTLIPEEMAGQCAALAADTARAGLTGTPTREQARATADRLDGRLTQLRDPRVHDAAVALHSHLHGVEAALAKGDTDRAATLAAAAREDAAKAAKACGLAETAFLGG